MLYRQHARTYEERMAQLTFGHSVCFTNLIRLPNTISIPEDDFTCEFPHTRCHHGGRRGHEFRGDHLKRIFPQGPTRTQPSGPRQARVSASSAPAYPAIGRSSRTWGSPSQPSPTCRRWPASPGPKPLTPTRRSTIMGKTPRWRAPTGRKLSWCLTIGGRTPPPTDRTAASTRW